MSRVAKNPVAIPAKVEVVLSADAINVSGPLGKLTQPLTSAVVLKKRVMRLLLPRLMMRSIRRQCQAPCVLWLPIWLKVCQKVLRVN